ncbi:MAG: hypothetical protein GQE15_37735 [Archangiaceae bacterium]|nr:hypothetical protein [Archangiaceae bacterium]
MESADLCRGGSNFSEGSQGTEHQKKHFAEKMFNGQSGGTTCLTEAHAGSDVGSATAEMNIATARAWRKGAKRATGDSSARATRNRMPKPAFTTEATTGECWGQRVLMRATG